MLSSPQARTLYLCLGGILILGARVWCQTLPPLPARQTVGVNGHKIAYYEAGKGDAIILIHGLGADARHWANNIGPLSGTHRVIALDLLGFGQSDKPLMRYTVANFVASLHGFLKALHIPRASLVGNSLGGWITLDFATRYPKMVEKLVLVDAAGLKPEIALKWPPGGPQPLSILNVRKFFDFIAANKEWAAVDLGPNAFERHLENGDSYTIASSVAEMATGKEFEDARLDKVKAPTLIIWGRDDALIPLSMGERLHHGIAGSQLLVLEGTGHVPMLGKPAEFNLAIAKFLSSS